MTVMLSLLKTDKKFTYVTIMLWCEELFLINHQLHLYRENDSITRHK